VGEEDLELVRRSIELFMEGDRDAGWALWSEDCIGIPPRDWPESEPLHGRDQVREAFTSWNVVFGEEWTTHLRINEARDLGEGRVLIALGFKASGVESGLPIDQEIAAIYTVRGREIVKAEYFMTGDEARSAAGYRVSNLDHIRSYYEALNTGDANLVASHFTDDAIHYYTRLGPHVGAERIGQNSKMGVEMIDGQWYLEHGIEQGDEAVIEWTMTWRDPKSGEKRLDRGTEWFLMRDGKIAEVRAYHHGNKKNPQGDLLGFDHAGRGYTTMDDWRPPSRS
jgi:ketosteroid isomerase-like protein